MNGRLVTALALATFFVVVQFYTSLASLSATPPVGYVFANRAVAVALIASLVSAVFIALVRLVRERIRPDATSRALLLAWLGAASVSAVLGLDPLAGVQVVAIMALCALGHLGLVAYLRERRTRQVVLGAYLALGGLATLGALAMVASHRPAELWTLNHGRAAGVFVTANQFAAFLIAFIFVALGVAYGERGGWRVLGLGCALVGCAALIATVSQAGWLGAAAGAIFFAVALGARRAALGFAVALVVAAAFFAIRPATRHNPAEAFDRVRIWTSGVRVATLFPLTGVGPMAYWRVYPAVRPPNADSPGTFGALHPHDVYLSLAAETGVVGLVAFGFGWWRFARAMRVRLRASALPERALGIGACAALVAVFVQGLFDTVGVVELTFVWIPYAALALGSVAPAEAIRS